MQKQYLTPASVFFDEILQAHRQIVAIKDRYPRFRMVLENACKELTKDDGMHFADLFGRLTYLTQREGFDRRETGRAHQIRMRANAVLHKGYLPTESEYLADLEAVIHTIGRLFRLPIPPNLQACFPTADPTVRRKAVLSASQRPRIAKMRVQIVGIEGDVFWCQWDEQEEEPIRVLVNVEGHNDLFRETARVSWIGAQLNLLDVDHLPENTFRPQYLILEPDYLVDVTAVARCFTNYANTPLFYLLNKFQPRENSKPLVLGNLANHILDRVLHQPEHKSGLRDLLKESFRDNALSYTTCADLQDEAKSREFAEEAKSQFSNIVDTVQTQFPAQKIYPNHAVLEPTFLSETYGLQGRLDLYQPPVGDTPAKIVELKSGRAGDYGMELSTEHHAQATMYRLMLQSTFGFRPEEVMPAILYSKLSVLERNLRFAPYLMTEEKRFLDMRNRVVAMEYGIARDKSLKLLWAYLKNLAPAEWQKNFSQTPNFQFTKLAAVYDKIRAASPLEGRYFLEYVRFIAEEQLLSKIGDPAYESSNGQAALWANSFTEKKEAYEILYDLTIDDNRIATAEKTIVFRRPEGAPASVNFRLGDLCAVYPRESEKDDIRSNQVLKGTITGLTNTHVTVTFRYQQRNPQFFAKYSHWALEHDSMDSSFATQYQSLMHFLKAPAERRALLLGERAPVSGVAGGYYHSELRPEQMRLVEKALAAKDYFLLIGPPGTGKTSVMLRALVEELYQQTEQNLLITAYTNKAVDEICEAIAHLPFLRIGSSLSTDPRFGDRLLDRLAGSVESRQELQQRLQEKRIYVSTVASLASRPELLKLKTFDVALVDEASQILEPQLIGLLAQVPKFILIGDQKQLPAIVLQSPKRAVVESAELKAIGLSSLKNSLFERLLARAQQKGWEWAWGMLSHQGRMHQEVAWFANRYFYDNALQVIRPEQVESLSERYTHYDASSPLETLLATRRLAYIPSHAHPDDSPVAKCNTFEAQLVIQLIKKLQVLYAKNGLSFNPETSVGVITPYRNQIATIKLLLEKEGVPGHDRICVDTVERYQGGQRDVIIYSFSVNTRRQVDQLPNLSDDGRVDRKLNVAVTRARHQLIFTGQTPLLNVKPLFKRLTQWVFGAGGYVQEGIVAALTDAFTVPEQAESVPENEIDFELEMPF